MVSAEQAVLRIENAMVHDFNTGKLDQLLGHFHPRVLGFSSTRRERIAGRAAMRKTFDYYLQASARIKYQIAKPQVQVFGDMAVATFYWTVKLGTGRPQHVIQGRGSHVFAHQDEKWLIVHEHFSRAH
jgi:ketosteroid isomerase-like protein